MIRKLPLKTFFALACLSVCAGLGSAQEIPFLQNNSILDSLQSITASTVPANGDLNPYGVAFVPARFPSAPNVVPGDVLVSNFNNSSALGNLEEQARPSSAFRRLAGSRFSQVRHSSDCQRLSESFRAAS